VILDDLIQVGHLKGAHGIRGYTWVISRTDPIENIFDYQPWYLKRPTGFQAVQVEDHRAQGRGWVVKLDVSPDRTAAELLAMTEIWVPKSALPSLEEDEYFWSELIGMRVVTTTGVLLGTLDAWMETGANDVIVVRPCAGSVDTQERLLPWLVRRVVQFVDRQQRVITVDWDPEF